MSLISLLNLFKEPFSDEPTPSLNVQKWKEFRYNELFDIELGKPYHKNKLTDGNIRYVTRSQFNNGVSNMVECDKINSPNVITIGGEGILAFYQNESFVCGNKISILKNKMLNKYVGMFLITIMNKESYRYNYGRARVKSKIEKETIKLPVTDDGTPDWDFMENYIKTLPYSNSI